MKIETKYSLYDAVWFMWNNKAVCRNISRVYTWVDKEEQYETYDVQCDGEDDFHLSEYTFELDELFPTKEELLKSL